MKQILPFRWLFTTLFITLLQTLCNAAFAAAPTKPPANIQFSYTDGDRIRISWANGDGTGRIVVIRKDAAVTALPVNGTTYTANTVFGSGSAIQPNQYVVYASGVPSSVDVTGLLPATKYYVAVFESNGTGFQTEYLTSSYATSHFTTASAPLKQASGIVQTEVTGNKINLKWTNGDGQGRILVARKGSPVNINPVDLTVYDDNSTFGSGSQIGSGNFVVQSGWMNTASITGLETSTTYHFALFEYNGNYGPVYQTTTPASFSVSTAARPTAPATGMAFSSIEGSELTISFTSGNGTRRIIVARKGSEVTAVPQDGTGYTSHPVFGNGADLGSGQYVVGTGTSNSYKIQGLQPGTTYHVAVFEFDGEGTTARYLTSSFLKGSKATVVAPTLQASKIVVTDILTTSAKISFTRGNGEKALVVVKEGSPVDATPADLTAYAQSTNFGGGGQIGNGNYVIAFGSAAFTSIAALPTNKTFHVKVFEANGNTFPMYNTTNAPEASFSTSARPSTPSADIDFSYIEGNSMRIGWKSGNGIKRIIIAREGAAVTALPQDGMNYTASANFGSGQQIAPGEYVVYNNNGGSMYMNALQPGKTYHVAIFEYSLDGIQPYYLTASFPAASRATVSAPTQAPTNIHYTNISSNSITVNWTSGNGNRRILLARAGSPVTATLEDLKGYTSGLTIGTGSNLGNGNYVITSGDITSANVNGLQKGTRYYFKVIEYNGFTGPVYLQSTVLTGDAVAAARPTTGATDPKTNNIEGNSIRYSWTSGNGERRVVIARAGAEVTSIPVDGQQYTANAIFGSGQQLQAGEYVVADGNLTSVDLKGLQAGTTYFIKVFEYDDLGTNAAYNTTHVLSFSEKTLTAPAIQAKDVTGSGATASTVNVGWTIGNGQKRLVIGRAGAPVNVLPSDYLSYLANTAFGSGANLGDGNFAIYSGTESSTTVTNLQAGVTYHFAVFEYNGNTGPVYLKTASAKGEITTIGPPTASAYDLHFTNPLSIGSVQLNWTIGSGHRRLVIAKEGSPVDFTPVDKVMYTPNSFFGSGQMVGNQNYVVFSGTNNFVNVTNLEKTKTYYFAVFEYNLFPDGPRYRITNIPTASFVGATLPVTWISFTATKQNAAVQLSWKIVEKDNARFEVEQSENGSLYRTATSIASKGDGENSYQWVDKQAKSGVQFYRIKQVDFDGKYSYSPVVKTTVDQKGSMELKQTVVTTQVLVTINDPQVARGRLFISDASGRMLQQVQAKAGVNTLSIAHYSAGIYFISYGSETSNLQTFRFVKQ
ncbi:MAG TPA: fibronectin type III domain-containing protein [Flavisolibacter sp.]|jgi:hypothetical protein|nr:fibronectin type III domain-containing protein [Flavisolibacter sp.]